MHLTILQILKEVEVFSEAKIIAGEKGAEKLITWTHISEHKDFIEWIKPGTLLLSSGFILKDEPEVFAEKIPLFVEKGLNGLVIAVGSHIKNIPKIVIDNANKYDFPIIILPATIPLMEITHEIHKRIINLNYALIEESFNIHKILNKVVLDGGGLNDLALEMAKLIKRSITIEDPALNLLAHAEYGVSDKLRERTIKEGKTPDEIVAYLETSGILKSVQTHSKAYKVPCVPELGFCYERVVAPILVGSQLYGYFWIIAGEEQLNDMDYIVIERGATIASLIMSRKEAIYRAEQNIICKLFDDIIDPYSNNDIYDVAKLLNILGVEDYYQIMLVEHGLNEFITTNRLHSIIKEILSQEGVLLRIFEKGNRFVILLRGNINFDNEKITNRIVMEAYEKGYKLTVGLSNCSNQITQLNQHYQEAIDALKIGKSLSENNQKVWSYEKLGSLSYLLNIPSEFRSKNKFYKLAESIANYDINHGTDYFHTLEVYLDNKLNSQEAARRLYIHRNTIYQRLRKITDNWNIDFDDTYCVLNLHIAIKEWHIQKMNSK